MHPGHGAPRAHGFGHEGVGFFQGERCGVHHARSGLGPVREFPGHEGPGVEHQVRLGNEPCALDRDQFRVPGACADEIDWGHGRSAEWIRPHKAAGGNLAPGRGGRNRYSGAGAVVGWPWAFKRPTVPDGGGESR